MIYTSIIFDLDGTIVNTEQLWREATRQLLLTYGIYIAPEIQDHIDRAVRGLPLEECCSIIKNMFQLNDSIETIARLEIQFVSTLYEKHICFMPGFIEFYDHLKKNEYKMAIASNCTDMVMAKASHALQLDQFFGKHIYGISCVDNIAKPKPDIFLHAATQIKSHPSACIVFEDSPHGIQAAKAAGMKCIAISTPSMRNSLNQADLIIDSFDQIDLQNFQK